MYKYPYLFIIMSIFSLAGCSTQRVPQPQLNPLQIQAMQTQQFSVSKQQAFNAVMTVMQNRGYVIKNASLNTGFITAESSTQSTPFISQPPEHYSAGAIAAATAVTALAVAIAVADTDSDSNNDSSNVSSNNKPHKHKQYSLLVTAFLSALDAKQTKIRLNLVQHEVVTKYGSTNKDAQVLNQKSYQDLFNAIRQQLFVAKAI